MVRLDILAMAGYQPGEQPRPGAPFVKLNTNENPYPPSPRVVEAVRAALTGDALRKYPDPLATDFRRAAAAVHGVDPDQILIGNGSDDVLTVITRTLVPAGGRVVSLTPSYLLYRTLAEIQGAEYRAVPFTEDWDVPDPWPAGGAGVTFLANPNSPSGTVVGRESLERLAATIDGPLVIDEAYAAFAGADALAMLQRPNVIVTRTLSKSHALAGVRFGYALASAELVRQFNKVKDSYNCDVLSIAAATAAISDAEYTIEVCQRIVTTRARLEAELRRFGFAVTPSRANFVWCRRGDRPVKPIHEELKQRGVLVRYMNYAGYGDGLRVTVGTDVEIDRFLEEMGRCLGG